jgi:hypothetical protein
MGTNVVLEVDSKHREAKHGFTHKTLKEVSMGIHSMPRSSSSKLFLPFTKMIGLKNDTS